MTCLKNRKIPYAAVLLCLLLISGCEDDSSPDPDLSEFHSAFTGTFGYQNESQAVLTNSLGGIMINGSSAETLIDYYIDRTLLAVSFSAAEEHFDEIMLQTVSRQDSLLIQLSSPPDTEELEYSGLYSVDLPYDIACHIAQAEGGVFISGMESELSMENVHGDISVQQFLGSVSIIGEGGQVEVQMVLQDFGSCRIITSTGDIELGLPLETSAQLSAVSAFGFVTIEDFTLTDPVTEDSPIGGESVEAVLGTGEGSIILGTVSGNIIVHALQP